MGDCDIINVREPRLKTRLKGRHRGSSCSKHFGPGGVDPHAAAVALRARGADVPHPALDRAHHLAVAEITRANESCDYYTLSIWREIRGIIRDQIELAEEALSEEALTNEPYL